MSKMIGKALLTLSLLLPLAGCAEDSAKAEGVRQAEPQSGSARGSDVSPQTWMSSRPEVAQGGAGSGVRAPARAGRAEEGASAAEMRRHVEYLASDELAGRQTGTTGIRRAEAYIAGWFRKYGLQPVPGAKGYFLDFTLYRVGFDPETTRLAGTAAGRRFRGRIESEFRPLDLSAEGEVEAEVVFAGYGITAPEYAYDDYRDLDVTGRIVLVLRHEPAENDPGSPFMGTTLTDHALFAEKVKNAHRHGAAGLILVSDPLHHPPTEDLRLSPVPLLRLDPPRAGAAGGVRLGGGALPAVQVSQELAGRIARGSGKTLEELQRAVDQGTPPAALGLDGARARIAVRLLKDAQEVAARNVAGFLPGSNPWLQDEWILIGAHHDHVGSYPGTGDTIYNGADDNASGTAGVLELARRFAATRPAPERSLLFVTFSAEESGLFGSRALFERKLIPAERLVFMVNMDMIGRNPDQPIDIQGDGYARALRPILEEANRGLQLPLRLFGTRVRQDSDFASFYRAEVPFLSLFTGLHEDYHRPGDEADELAYDRMDRIVKLVQSAVGRLARGEEPPRFLYHVGWLGLQYEVQGRAPQARAVVTGVMEGSPAAVRGVRVGDELAAIGGQELEDLKAADERFEAIRPGTAVELALRRGTGRVALEVQRAEPGYLGIVPRPAEEERFAAAQAELGPSVLVGDVVRDGPAAQAGLRRGDVLAGIDGQPVGVDTLDSRLDQIGAGRTVELIVLRGGAELSMQVTLGRRPSRG
jgi:hypothetical protein